MDFNVGDKIRLWSEYFDIILSTHALKVEFKRTTLRDYSQLSYLRESVVLCEQKIHQNTPLLAKN